MNFVAILIDVTIVKYVWKPVKHFGIEKHSNFLNSISIRLTAKQKKTKEAIQSKVFVRSYSKHGVYQIDPRFTILNIFTITSCKTNWEEKQ